MALFTHHTGQNFNDPGGGSGSFSQNLGGPGSLFVVAIVGVPNGAVGAGLTFSVNGTGLTLQVQSGNLIGIYTGTVTLTSDPQTISYTGGYSFGDLQCDFWTATPSALLSTTPSASISGNNNIIGTLSSLASGYFAIAGGDGPAGNDFTSSTPAPTNSYSAIGPGQANGTIETCDWTVSGTSIAVEYSSVNPAVAAAWAPAPSGIPIWPIRM